MATIELEETSSHQALQAVQRMLREFNLGILSAMKNPDLTERGLRVIARDSRKIVGGLIATTRSRWLKISIMAVEKSHRGRGVGRRLVRRAEQQARRRGCRFSYVDTMTYQAPEFYVKLGYRETGRLANWDAHGHDKVFFVKRLRR